MIQKQIVLKKIQDLKNFIAGARALLSTARTREEMQNQLDRIQAKADEIEILINRENESWN
jgi:hypothetical protein